MAKRAHISQAEISMESLPPFFPLVRRDCEGVSTEFFKCLSEKSEPQGNLAAGLAAIKGCKALQDAYTKCTRTSLSAKGAKRPIVLTEWESE